MGNLSKNSLAQFVRQQKETPKICKTPWQESEKQGTFFFLRTNWVWEGASDFLEVVWAEDFLGDFPLEEEAAEADFFLVVD